MNFHAQGVYIRFSALSSQNRSVKGCRDARASSELIRARNRLPGAPRSHAALSGIGRIPFQADRIPELRQIRRRNSKCKDEIRVKSFVSGAIYAMHFISLIYFESGKRSAPLLFLLSRRYFVLKTHHPRSFRSEQSLFMPFVFFLSIISFSAHSSMRGRFIAFSLRCSSFD